jgi:hypothetical protein
LSKKFFFVVLWNLEKIQHNIVRYIWLNLALWNITDGSAKLVYSKTAIHTLVRPALLSDGVAEVFGFCDRRGRDRYQ